MSVFVENFITNFPVCIQLEYILLPAVEDILMQNSEYWPRKAVKTVTMSFMSFLQLGYCQLGENGLNNLFGESLSKKSTDMFAEKHVQHILDKRVPWYFLTVKKSNDLNS